MRLFDTLSVASLQEVAIKLNKTNKKDIKIEWVERVQSHHPIDVLYSYEYENTKQLSPEIKISGA